MRVSTRVYPDSAPMLCITPREGFSSDAFLHPPDDGFGWRASIWIPWAEEWATLSGEKAKRLAQRLLGPIGNPAHSAEF